MDKENGLTTGGILSHTALFEIPAYHKKLLFMTDAAINVAPTVDEKAKILQQTVAVANAVGMECPKVACICAVEKVNTKHMPCTVDAAILQAMNKRGQISNCVVEGPFGMDNAISHESCKIKKISGEVAGQADILLMPDIEAGNVAYKLIMEFASGKLAAIVSGASAPIVLTSRADNNETKFLSLALAIAVAK